MTRAAPGKVSAELFDRVILARLGAPDASVTVGPRHGVDVGIVDLGAGQVMAVSADPVFIVPAYGWRRASWFAVHILASDTAMSGLAPRYMSVDLNLPRELGDDDLAELWEAFSDTCAELGISVVAGHTGRYDGTDWPMVGGATCIAVGPDDAWVTPADARPGDRVIITKGAAVEATALFGATFPERLAAAIGPELAAAADAMFESMTVVPEARVAREYGLRDAGVTAMHDATEGGVIGGLAELADAAGVGLRVDQGAIPVRPEAQATCEAAGIDPLTSISEGTLLATVRPGHLDGVLTAFAEAGIATAEIGEVTPAADGRVILREGRPEPLVHPGQDPFWEAFGRWAAGE